ncbi:16267_t:CDS:2, partial [Entrophospora sp. SA101]
MIAFSVQRSSAGSELACQERRSSAVDKYSVNDTVGEFVSIVFDAGFINQAELDLKAMVLDEVNPTTPISLCSVPGYDASYRVDNLVAEVH